MMKMVCWRYRIYNEVQLPRSRTISLNILNFEHFKQEKLQIFRHRTYWCGTVLYAYQTLIALIQLLYMVYLAHGQKSRLNAYVCTVSKDEGFQLSNVLRLATNRATVLVVSAWRRSGSTLVGYRSRDSGNTVCNGWMNEVYPAYGRVHI